MEKHLKAAVANMERPLTKGEEQIMQALWQHDKAYLKDVIESMPYLFRSSFC